MKRGLIVGIDYYKNAPRLKGCVNDAQKINSVIERNEDGSPNFDVKLLTSNCEPGITCKYLEELLHVLLTKPADMALFYFSGHGTATNLGGHICGSDAGNYVQGFSMQNLLTLINNSPVKEIVIILDCCHSGSFGNFPSLPANGTSLLREGVSILAACRENESSIEINGSGLFTSLVYDALSGGAADIQGVVTAAGVYSHVEQSFSAWDQRPLFKTYVSRNTPLRKNKPKIPLDILRQIPKLFPEKNKQFELDPSYEYTHSSNKPENVKKFKILKKLQTQGLIKVNRDLEPDLYWACLESKSCELTPLGLFYWELANANKI